jgi:hypothetical protein
MEKETGEEKERWREMKRKMEVHINITISNKNSRKKNTTTRKPLVCTLLAVDPVNYQIGFARRIKLYAAGRRKTKIELFSNYRCTFSYTQVTRWINRCYHCFLRTTIRVMDYHLRLCLHSTASKLEHNTLSNISTVLLHTWSKRLYLYINVETRIVYLI